MKRLFPRFYLQRPDIVILQELDHPATLKQFANLLDAQSFFAPSNTKRHVGLISRFANRVFTTRLRQCTIITLPPAVRQASDHLPVVAEFELA